MSTQICKKNPIIKNWKPNVQFKTFFSELKWRLLSSGSPPVLYAFCIQKVILNNMGGNYFEFFCVKFFKHCTCPSSQALQTQLTLSSLLRQEYSFKYLISPTTHIIAFSHCLCKMYRQGKLKETPVKLYYTSHCSMRDLNKQINTLLSLICYSYLNPVRRKDQILFRQMCALSLQLPLSTRKHLVPSCSLVLFFSATNYP